MASVTANISKGREVEFYNRILTNDPTNSAFIMLVLATGGDSLGTLQDYDTVSAVLAGPSAEVTNGGYSRKTITALSAWAPNDIGNSVALTLPVQTFTTIAAGDVWDIGVIAYDPDTTSGTDTTLVPVTFSELRISGVAIPGVGDNILIDFSTLWTTAV